MTRSGAVPGSTGVQLVRDRDLRRCQAVRPGGASVGFLDGAAQPNARHRAEVAKLLVHRDARGLGCATALLTALEETAHTLGRHVLVLDTQTGSTAERLYRRRGWQLVGTVDNYAAMPDGRLAPTTFMTKHL